MEDIVSEVISNSRKLNNSQRRASVVRACGEEHEGVSTTGTANIYLTLDNELCYVSDYKFKLVLNDGNVGTADAPITNEWFKGDGRWPTIDDFIDEYPVGSAVDTDGYWGAQSLVPGSMLLCDDYTYRSVESLSKGDIVMLRDGKTETAISDNNATDEELIDVKTTSGHIIGTKGHKMFVNGKAVRLDKLKHGDIIDTPHIEGVDLGLTSDQYKMLGFWLGDGHITFKGKTINTIGITVGTNAKEQYIRSLGVDLSWHIHSNGKAKIAYISATKRNEKLRKTISKYANKRIPVLFSGIEEVIEGFCKADGNVKRNNQVVITNTNKALLCAIQDMAWKVGYKAVMGNTLYRKKTNLCDHPKPIHKLSINFKTSREFIRGKVLSSSLAGVGKVYHTNVSHPDHSYVYQGLASHNCWDYANVFWWGQVNRSASTGGTGAAYGMWTHARAINAGTEFSTISNWNNIKRGDWVIWGNNTYGHVAMSAEDITGDTGKFYGQNQGGTPLPQGGSTINMTTLSKSNFLGAFRYLGWTA